MAVTNPSGPLRIELANALLACLCAAVQERPGVPEHCAFRVGIEPAADADLNADLCCEGLAYVMPGDSWPTEIFPNMDIVRQAESRCGPVAWVQEFRMGIMRCYPVASSDQGDMPTDAQWNAAAVQSMYDAESLERAVCCFRPTAYLLPQMDGLSIVANRMQQGAALGGCIERWITVQVELPGDCCPPLPTPIG